MNKRLFGNDGELFLYNEKDLKFATAESFSAQVFNKIFSVPMHFIGTEIPASNKILLTLHGVEITDEEAVKQMEKSALTGYIPVLNFQGKLRREDNINERVILRNLVQEGRLDNVELSAGYIGVWTFWVNDPNALKYFK